MKFYLYFLETFIGWTLKEKASLKAVFRIRIILMRIRIRGSASGMMDPDPVLDPDLKSNKFQFFLLFFFDVFLL